MRPPPGNARSAAFYNSREGPTTTNPNFGFTSFDDVVHAWLVVYRAITIEDWAVSMQMLTLASGAWGVVFLCLLVLVPGWLAANLALAVIYEQVHLHNMRQLRLANAELLAELAAEKEAAEREAAEEEERARGASSADGTGTIVAIEAASGRGGAHGARCGGGGSDGGGGSCQKSQQNSESGVLTVSILEAPTLRPAATFSLGRWRLRFGPRRPYRTPLRPSFGDGDGACNRCWRGLCSACEKATQWRWFNHVFTVLIALNTVVQCIAHAGMSLELCRTLDILSLAFTAIFTLEMIVKLLGLGVSGYMRDKTNIFDGAIVAVGILETIGTAAGGGSIIADVECASGINPSIFRTLRLVRLLHTIPSASLRELLSIISGAMWKTFALCLLFFLFLYTCALIALAYFGGSFDRCQECEPLPRPLDLPLAVGGIPMLTTTLRITGEGATSLPVAALGVGLEPQPMLYGGRAASLCECDPELRVCLDSDTMPYLNGGMLTTAGGKAAGCFARSPSANFDSFGDALLASFQIFTGEEYAYMIYLSMRNINIWTFVFYTLALILGRYVLLNMYTAVILSCLASQRQKAARPEPVKKAEPPAFVPPTAFGALLLKLQDVDAAGSPEQADEVTPASAATSKESAASSGPTASAPSSDTEDMASTWTSTPTPANGNGQVHNSGSNGKRPMQNSELRSMRAVSSSRGDGGSFEAASSSGPPPPLGDIHTLTSSWGAAETAGSSFEADTSNNTIKQLELNGRTTAMRREHSLAQLVRRDVIAVLTTTTRLAQISPRGAASRTRESVRTSLTRRRSSCASRMDDGADSAPVVEMTEDRAALMLQARFRQHKAWVNVRAIKLVREEQERLLKRGPSVLDPLGLGELGNERMMPAANATRRWQPPKFSACRGVEIDASMSMTAFEEDVKVDETPSRHKHDFEYLLPVVAAAPGAAPETVQDDEDGPASAADDELQARSVAPLGGRATGGYSSKKKQPSIYDRLVKHGVPRLRVSCNRMIEHNLFNGFIMVLILLSTIILCLDSPRLERNAAAGSVDAKATQGVIALFNFIFTGLFTVEMVIKIVALGIRGYFFNGFNLLDFFCVFVSWATIVPGGENLGALKSLRTLRGLRPLRLITRIQSMAIVIEALIRALPAIGNVALILIVFWLVFAILGVQVFGGALASCVLFVPGPLAGGDQLFLPMTALPNKTICAAMAAELESAYFAPDGLDGRSSSAFADGSLCAWPKAPRVLVSNETRCRLLWHQETSGFNNVGEGLLTLTEVALLQGWSQIMHRAMAARGPGLAPTEVPSDGTNTLVGAAFFVIFVIFGGFMLIKLFAGVVIDKFNRLRDERSGSAFMSDAEKEWVETRKLVQATKPLVRETVPTQPGRRQLYLIATNRFTEYFIMAMIILNVLFMAATSTYLPPGSSPPEAAAFVELVFTAFFLVEAGVKLLALLPAGYFRVPWNCFDFLLCGVSIFDMCFAGSISKDAFDPMLLRLLRMFRIARLVRLVRSAKGLRTLLLTISRCMPALAIICSLLALNAIIFATIGMALFGNVIPQPHYGLGKDWPAFDTFPSAFLIMLVMATSEQMPSLMRASAVSPPFCGAAAGMVADDSDCGAGMLMSALFFVMYQLIGALLLMNLMVGVVVDEFSSTSIQQNMRVPQTAINEFQEIWIRLDPDGTGFISAHYLPYLLSRLLPPLGVKETELYVAVPGVAILKRLGDAWLPLRYGQVQFQETLFALARVEVGQRLPECALRTKLDRHARRVLDLRHLKHAPVLWNAHEYYAAEMIQRTYRGFRAREALHAHKQREIKRERVTQAFRISSTLLTSFVAADSARCTTRLAERPRSRNARAAAQLEVSTPSPLLALPPPRQYA